MSKSFGKVLSVSEEQVDLDRLKKKKLQRIQDERTVDKVEQLEDKKLTLNAIQQSKYDAVEKTKAYFRTQIEIELDKYRKEVERLENLHATKLEKLSNEHNKTTSYYKSQLEDCDRKQEAIENAANLVLSSVERKKVKLVKKILTPDIKNQVEEVEEEKIAPPVPVTRQKHLDQQELLYLMKQEEARQIEKKMMEKWTEIRRLDAEMKSLKCRPNVSEEEIDALQFKINGLVQEREFLKQTIPKF